MELEAYLSDLAVGAAAQTFTVGPATGLAPPAPGRLPSETYQAMEDRRMWEFDRRWYSPSLYRDVRVCVRQPNVGGPWITENTQYLYDNNFVCQGWRGAGASDGAGATLLSALTYWSVPCNAEARENAFQYERYRWAQDKMRALVGNIPADPAAKLTWIAELTGLMTAAAVATNARLDGDFLSRLFPGDNTSHLRPTGPLVIDPFTWTYAGSAGSTPQWLPLPGSDRYPGKLFPVVPVGQDKGAFVPQVRVRSDLPVLSASAAGGYRRMEYLAADQEALLRVGIGHSDPAEALRRLAAAGAGRAVIDIPLSFGTAQVLTLDNWVQRTFLRAEGYLSKSYFDWIKVALEYYKDRMSSFWSGRAMTPDQEMALRLIQEGITITTDASATMSANNAWSSLSTVLGLITMVATAVNAAVGAVVAVVAALLVTGLTELSKALGYGVLETLAQFTDPWPPFVRIMQEPCVMPTSEAAVRSAVGRLNPELLRRATALPQQTERIRQAIATATCPAGTTGTPPNCELVRSKTEKSGAAPLLIGAGALLLLSRLVK